MVTVEVEKESKLLPIFVPILKKDAVSSLAAVKEALALRNDHNLHQILGSPGYKQTEGGVLNNQKLEDLCSEKEITLSFTPGSPTIIKWYSRENGWDDGSSTPQTSSP